MLTRTIYGQVSDEQFKKFISSIPDNCTEDLRIYLMGPGGNVSIEHSYIHFFNNYPGEITLVSTGMLASAYTGMFFLSNTKKVVYPTSYAMFHPGYISKANLSNEPDATFHREVSIERTRLDNERFFSECETFMSAEEVADIKNSLPLYINYDRLKVLAKNAEKIYYHKKQDIKPSSYMILDNNCEGFEFPDFVSKFSASDFDKDDAKDNNLMIYLFGKVSNAFAYKDLFDQYAGTITLIASSYIEEGGLFLFSFSNTKKVVIPGCFGIVEKDYPTLLLNHRTIENLRDRKAEDSRYKALVAYDKKLYRKVLTEEEFALFDNEKTVIMHYKRFKEYAKNCEELFWKKRK